MMSGVVYVLPLRMVEVTLVSLSAAANASATALLYQPLLPLVPLRA
jgi:hypothetical protein